MNQENILARPIRTASTYLAHGWNGGHRKLPALVGGGKFPMAGVEAVSQVGGFTGLFQSHPSAPTTFSWVSSRVHLFSKSKRRKMVGDMPYGHM